MANDQAEYREFLQGSENIHYNNIIVDIGHSKSVQPHRKYNSKNNL